MNHQTSLNYDFTYLYNQNKPHQAYKIGDWSYEYDANGNVIRKSLGGGGGANATLSTDLDMTNPNQHDAQRPNDIWLSRDSNDDPPATTTTTVADSYELPYNLEESETVPDEDKQVRYTWNETNRLMEAEVSGETTTFLYDAGGERTIKKDRFGETTYVNKFFQVQNRDTITKHIFVGSTRIVSKLSHMEDSGDLPFEENNIYYYHGDHLGNTTYITDKYGDEWEHFEYAPYGETWVTDENVSQSFGYRFTSKELDESTGLYNFGARYLDAETGRWLSCDPALNDYLPTNNKEYNRNLPGQGGVYNPVNLNHYHYSNNNPIKYIDPDGKSAKDYDDATLLSAWGITDFMVNNVRYFGQRDFQFPIIFDFPLLEFGAEADNTACFLTSLLNEFSEEFTNQTGETLSIGLAYDLLTSVIDEESGETLMLKNAYIKDSEGILNKWTSLVTGMNGKWVKDNDSEAQSHQIYLTTGWFKYKRNGTHMVNSGPSGNYSDTGLMFDTYNKKETISQYITNVITNNYEFQKNEEE
jgi:RHS repeat-associated protein